MFAARTGMILCLSLLASMVWGQEFYRYKDAEGRTVLDTKIPGQYVNAGYDVLDSSGRLVETVPPVGEEESLEAVQANQIADRALSDQVLLTSYSHVEEIEAHRVRKVEAMEREISIIETDQRVVQIEIDKALEEKADFEERDREVPVEVLELIDELRLTMVKLDEQLERRRAEIIEVDNEFTGKKDRFKQLKAGLQAP